MAAIEILSPNVSLNSSSGMNASVANTPSSLNNSDRFKFLMPKGSASKMKCSPWSPATCSKIKSPSISPIVNSAESSEKFLRRRELIYVRDNEANRRMKVTPKGRYSNSNLDTTLSVAMVLRDLELPHLKEAFEREEIDLTVFFTLSDDDLHTIGLEDAADREKILNFINDFNTPKKPPKIPIRNPLFRH